ncbi:ribonuclease III [Roseomonas gilardii]|uniref:Ribonuclease 3 n=1 Tax=Roseomonas gilardii TaxID=257708 RepID=A0A1L7AEM2_9PROT|nr:ribonuclease III [Roseomonas gilardii]APT57191.1 ribonuclease III [Roseomonas gilardii]MDT8331896.1 ribonuclease III [Roseomonas gilardii]PZR16404.1 MAG: ribonuclease III [Azospirillum brasilense]
MSDFTDRLGHRFANPALLSQALTHRSAADPRRRQLDSNERLEFLGDRVLALAIAEWLAERFPQEREGELGKRLAVLVAADTLAKVGEGIGLSEALRIPPAEGRTGLRQRATVLADATEALIGALYLDGGLEVAQRFVRRYWAEMMAADPTPPMSAKSRLQEWTLGRGLGLPVYRTASTTGPSHAPVFVIEVQAQGRTAEGKGDTKRAAEQAAAEAWLAGLPPEGRGNTGPAPAPTPGAARAREDES